MLVLSRKVGESIVIQDQIEVTVLSVEGETVRIGVKAPKQVDIFREEVYLSIQESNQESATPTQAGMNALIKMVDQKNKN
ncbi:carbon storage regulator, CsrA [Paenibacillus uliginis N3/975]|uniref:Translational regulator CsrA n=1 Tax=Paenibacillus uliginis N3/975 TaxID=1313296 RepID=A0A1X7GCE2_9BACL|nr:carbon storage regulator CsrA [Paenibacillus uliginis]SMF67217.1 carbon storage regulator, CsrA [Paenibacillus uliginis N3/975]